MTNTELQQVRDALSINRVMAKDANGNYTREVTPKLITEAIAICEASLARVVEPVLWWRTGSDTVMHNIRFEKPDSGPWTALYATPQAAAQPSQAVELSDAEILNLVDTHVGEPNHIYPLGNRDWINFARAVIYKAKGAA